MAKVLLVLFPDPVEGFAENYARDSIPKLSENPNGQSLPTPRAPGFTPGALTLK